MNKAKRLLSLFENSKVAITDVVDRIKNSKVVFKDNNFKEAIVDLLRIEGMPDEFFDIINNKNIKLISSLLSKKIYFANSYNLSNIRKNINGNLLNISREVIKPEGLGTTFYLITFSLDGNKLELFLDDKTHRKISDFLL